jgi:N-acetylmuramoyl-L-alanine amidase
METIKIGSKGASVKALQALLHLYEDGMFGSLTEEAVKEFQRDNHLTPDGIVGPATWDKIQRPSVNRKITEIIIHCTATKEGTPYTVEMIRRQHQAQGWSDIGYHYVIYADGSLHAGRPLNTIGAHCKGHNSNSIGICYVGGCDKDMKPKDTRTDAQKETLLRLIRSIKALHPTCTIHGHNEFAAKACPSFNVKEEYKDL